jgi:hypothetical protein
MCASVFCNGQEISTVGALQALFGNPLIPDPCYTPDRLLEDDCLCPVDIEASAFAAGYRATQTNDGDWVVKLSP